MLSAESGRRIKKEKKTKTTCVKYILKPYLRQMTNGR